MELLECGHATNDKREHCEVYEQRFNELEYGGLKYKDMGPYALGAWVLIYGCIYGCMYLLTIRISRYEYC